jgi:hypothetical protein
LQGQLLTCCGKAMTASASVRGSALCKHNHLQPVGRQQEDQHQQGDLHLARTITYSLWEGNDRISISKGSALCKHNHLQPVGRQWQHQHQQGGLHFASTITYSLWESNGSISISKRVCTAQAQSLTYCGKAMAELASAKGSALCKHNNLHTVGRQWQNLHQQGGLHFASTITYILWEGNGRISISKRVCTVQTQSLTYCGKDIAGLASARGSALCKLNHLHPAGRQWHHECQPRGPHFASTITYSL